MAMMNFKSRQNSNIFLHSYEKLYFKIKKKNSQKDDICCYKSFITLYIGLFRNITLSPPTPRSISDRPTFLSTLHDFIGLRGSARPYSDLWLAAVVTLGHRNSELFSQRETLSLSLRFGKNSSSVIVC